MFHVVMKRGWTGTLTAKWRSKEVGENSNNANRSSKCVAEAKYGAAAKICLLLYLLRYLLNTSSIQIPTSMGIIQGWLLGGGLSSPWTTLEETFPRSSIFPKNRHSWGF